MGNIWLKIKVWTKVIVVSALVLYALLFILNNSGQSVKFWFWFFKAPYETSLLVLVFSTFIAGIVAAVLVRTSFVTIRQIREIKARNRSERLARDMEEMKSKASRLQTKPLGSSETVPLAPSETDVE